MGIPTITLIKAAVCLGALLWVSIVLKQRKQQRSGNTVGALRLVERLAIGPDREVIVVETATEQLTILVMPQAGTVLGRVSRFGQLTGRQPQIKLEQFGAAAGQGGSSWAQ